MVPIQDIFDDIKEYFNTKEVSILTVPMATHLHHGNSIGPRTDRSTQQAEVVDQIPAASEEVSVPAFSRLHEDEEIQGKNTYFQRCYGKVHS